MSTEGRAAPDVVPRPSGGHQSELDGVRGAAAIYVVLTHAWLEIATQLEPRDSEGFGGLLVWALSRLLGYGHFAVDAFIVLSGFCLMLPVTRAGTTLKGGAKSFFRKRARRILPPFYFALAFSMLFIATVGGKRTGTHWDSSLPMTWQAIAANVLMLQDVIETSRINHVFWSVAVEWKIYFLFPALVIAWRRFGAFRTTAVVCVVTWAAAVLLHKTSLDGLSVHYIGLFCMGMLAAGVGLSGGLPGFGPKRLRRIGLLLIAAVMLTCWARQTKLAYPFAGWVYVDPFVGLGVAIFLAGVFGDTRSLSGKIFGSRWLVGAGVVSYSLYLIHAPLLHLSWQLLVKPSGARGLLAFALECAGFPLVLAGTLVFWQFCERPFLTKKPVPRALAAEPNA